jgi:DNA-binding transcriptional regulator YiaG
MALPRETEETLRQEATIGAADIEKARQMAAKLAGTVKYLDGREIKRIRAERLRGLWQAEGE